MPGGDAPRERGAAAAGEPGEAPSVYIPVNPEVASAHIARMRSRLALEEAGKTAEEPQKRLVGEIADLAHLISVPWLSDAGIAVTVDPKGFTRDTKRKLLGMAMLLRRAVEGRMEACLRLLDALAGTEDLIDVLRDHVRELDVKAPTSTLVLQGVEALCIPAIRTGINAIYAYVEALDRILGAVQVNLPASVMPNAHKTRLGVLSD